MRVLDRDTIADELEDLLVDYDEGATLFGTSGAGAFHLAQKIADYVLTLLTPAPADPACQQPHPDDGAPCTKPLGHPLAEGHQIPDRTWLDEGAWEWAVAHPDAEPDADLHPLAEDVARSLASVTGGALHCKHTNDTEWRPITGADHA